MIAWIAARAGVSGATIKAIAGLALALVIVLAFIWYGAEREREGAAKRDAYWIAANERMQRKAVEAMTAADAQAQVREAEQRNQIEELRNEADKGTAEPVGDGVRNVLERLRRQQGSR